MPRKKLPPNKVRKRRNRAQEWQFKGAWALRIYTKSTDLRPMLTLVADLLGVTRNQFCIDVLRNAACEVLQEHRIDPPALRARWDEDKPNS